MHVGPDPYAKQRRWWPILSRMARQLYWTWWVLSGLGLLSKTGPLTRWLERRFVEVEHGLRCLLIIKASGAKRFTPKADRSSKSDTSDEVTEADDLLKQILGPRSGYRRVGFNLTLSGFDEKPQQPPPFALRALPPQAGAEGSLALPRSEAPSSPVYGGSTGAAGDGGTEVTPLFSPADQFAARLAAIESVFNDADGYATRIARRIHAKGWRLIRLIAKQLTDCGFTLDPGWPRSVDAGPRPIPILDSS